MKPTDQRHSCLETVVLSGRDGHSPLIQFSQEKRTRVEESKRRPAKGSSEGKPAQLTSALHSKNDPDIISKGAEALLCPCIQVPSELPRNPGAEGSVDSQVDGDGISITPGAATSCTIVVSHLITENLWGKSLHWAPSRQ